MMLYNKLMPGFKTASGEKGFASIIIAMVIVLVLSLMTVGFAQLMQREQRSALDKQLSSQAYYAAESGVNDASKAINQGYSKAKTKCGSTGSANATDGSVDTSMAGSQYLLGTDKIATSTNASYTCLLIDPAPTRLDYSPITTDQSKPILLTGVNRANPSQYEIIGSIKISWQVAAGTDAAAPVAPNSRQFRPAANWTYTPVLRIMLTPLSSGNINRNYLINNSLNAFLYPGGGGGTPYSFGSYFGVNGGGILDGNCGPANTPRFCTLEINGLSQFNYMLDIRSIYANSTVTITAKDTAGADIRITNAQTSVDSTGKAQDTVRRIQVKLPSRGQYPIPDYSLQTMDNICKQLKLTPTVNTGNNCN